MSDLGRDAEELGRQIWPDRRAVLRSMPRRGRRWWWFVLLVRRSRLALLAAAALSLLMIGSVVLAATVTVRTLVADTTTAPSGGVRGGGGVTAAGTASAPAHLGGGRAPGPTGSHATAQPATGGAPDTPAALANPPFGFPLGPSPTPSPSGLSITITYQNSNGRTIFVGPGETIYVELSPTRLGSHWSIPHSANASVVKELSAAANGDGSARARFVATGRGQAVLSAAESNCPSTDPSCLGPAMLWQVTIQVS